jgi:recombination protein RecA
MAKAKKEPEMGPCKDAEQTMAMINKKYGDGSILLASSRPIIDVPAISTGSAGLDSALGVWGIPKGRVIEIYGPEGSGKTSLTLSIIKECQQSGGTAAFVDAEHALDIEWAENIGVNMDTLMLSQPDSGEQALTIVEMLTASKQVDLIVIDSVAALVPQAEIDGEMGDSHIGAQARLMSQAMRKLVKKASAAGCAIIFINQIRMKIGVMFGNPETTPGGRALKFYASVRMDIRRLKAIKDGDINVGNEVKIKVVKNKVAPPFKTAICALYFGLDDYPYGIDYASSLVNLAVEAGIVKKQSSWYNYGDIRLGNGYNNACALLRENEDLQKELESKVREVYDKRIKKNPEPTEPTEQEDFEE